MRKYYVQCHHASHFGPWISLPEACDLSSLEARSSSRRQEGTKSQPATGRRVPQASILRPGNAQPAGSASLPHRRWRRYLPKIILLGRTLVDRRTRARSPMNRFVPLTHTPTPPYIFSPERQSVHSFLRFANEVAEPDLTHSISVICARKNPGCMTTCQALKRTLQHSGTQEGATLSPIQLAKRWSATRAPPVKLKAAPGIFQRGFFPPQALLP